MAFSEQFIQDAVSHHDRLQRILRTQQIDWQFDTKKDYLNQEVSIPNGRIDTLATFERCKNVLVVEVKAGMGCDEHIQQLKSYLENTHSLKAQCDDLCQMEKTVGLLVAEDFSNITDDLDGAQPIYLVKFQLVSGQFPFRVVTPEATRNTAEVERDEGPSIKRSGLHRLTHHASWIREKGLQDMFNEAANCFLDPGDERYDWVVTNVKGQYVAVHYKGEYVMGLSVRRSGFSINRATDEGPWTTTMITMANRPEFDKAQTSMRAWVGIKDKQMEELLRGFSWRNCAP